MAACLMNTIAVRILAAFAAVLTLAAKTHVPIPVAVLAVAFVFTACLAAAVLAAIGLGRLLDHSAPPHYQPAWRAA